MNISLTVDQERKVLSDYRATAAPTALREPIVQWCEEAGVEIPRVRVNQMLVGQMIWNAFYLSFTDERSAVAFKVRWL